MNITYPQQQLVQLLMIQSYLKSKVAVSKSVAESKSIDTESVVVRYFNTRFNI